MTGTGIALHGRRAAGDIREAKSDREGGAISGRFPLAMCIPKNGDILGHFAPPRRRPRRTSTPRKQSIHEQSQRAVSAVCQRTGEVSRNATK